MTDNVCPLQSSIFVNEPQTPTRYGVYVTTISFARSYRRDFFFNQNLTRSLPLRHRLPIIHEIGLYTCPCPTTPSPPPTATDHRHLLHVHPAILISLGIAVTPSLFRALVFHLHFLCRCHIFCLFLRRALTQPPLRPRYPFIYARSSYFISSRHSTRPFSFFRFPYQTSNIADVSYSVNNNVNYILLYVLISTKLTCAFFDERRIYSNAMDLYFSS